MKSETAAAAMSVLSQYAAEDTADEQCEFPPPQLILQSGADGSGSKNNILELTNVFS